MIIGGDGGAAEMPRYASCVGNLIPFRRRRWTRSRDYGFANPRRDVTLRGVARDTFRWLRALRPFILLAILVSAYVGAGDPALVEPPAFLSSDPERVSETFTRCGPARGHACVIDGDTFKLGARKIRMIGIDAPETHPARCAAEARLGEQATARLQALLNDGPFEMAAWAHNRHDRYGRELMAISRKLPDGRAQSLAAEMRESGLAHRYAGGFKAGWC
jgi:endonuclease YncB( thermonuclease family)